MDSIKIVCMLGEICMIFLRVPWGYILLYISGTILPENSLPVTHVSDLYHVFRCTTVAMDASKLKESAFWNKKLDKSAVVFDVDKNGHISRADFLLMRERFSQQNVSKKYLEEFNKSQEQFLDHVNLKDNSVKYTYAEMKEKFIEYLQKASEGFEILMENSFKLLDLNDNGVISFEEWKSHYVVRGIPTEYARASFDAMDKNGDGEILLEEFVAYNYEFFCSDEDKLSSSILYGPLE